MTKEMNSEYVGSYKQQRTRELSMAQKCVHSLMKTVNEGEGECLSVTVEARVHKRGVRV